MSGNPTPNFHNLTKYQSLSTKKERKNFFPALGPPPKAPVRSCPVTRIYSIFKEEAPRPVSFREDSDSTFISESTLYATKNKGTYFEQCFTIEKILGRGSFGEVFKVISKESGLSYACKRTLLKYRGELDRFRRIEEVKKHEQLPPHINCVRFFRAWEEANQLYLLTEVCRCSLAHVLLNNHEFPESKLWSFLVDILRGLHHLHEHKLMHMDVKPDNIFIGTDGFCKLGDFGLVIDFSNGYPREAVDGDPKYLAPECLQNVYTPAADVFSLGMVMLELATDLYLPHSGPHWHQLRTGEIPSLQTKGFSPEFESLLRGFLDPNWQTRLSSSEATHLHCVRRVVRRKGLAHFFKSKALSLKCYVQSLLVWPIVLLTFVLSAFSLRFLEAPPARPQNILEVTAGLGLSAKRPKASEVVDGMDTPAPAADEASLLLLSGSIVNSTPICSLKRRQTFPRPDFSRCVSDEDSVDGSKFSFNESSICNLEESSHDDLPGKGQNVTGLPSVSRNLVDLFDTLDSSDEDV